MTLKHSPLTGLIHAVLDGEASDADKHELERRLAADPAARAELEDWKRLFEALDAMPKEHAPEGLVASITAAMPDAPGATDVASQPFPVPRVLGHTPSGISRRVPTRSITMSEQSSRKTFAKRKAWLGGGIAAAVVVVVTQVALDFPLSKDVVGTIIPAQRYRAVQNGSEQVQLGTRADQAAPTGTVPDASRALAEKSAAEPALSAERSQAQLTAERSQAQLTADRSQAQATAERSQAQATAERSQAQVMADKVHAERVKADKMHAEKMLAEKMLAEKVKADRTTQQ